MRIVPEKDVPYPRMKKNNVLGMSQTMVHYLAEGICRHITNLLCVWGGGGEGSLHMIFKTKCW